MNRTASNSKVESTLTITNETAEKLIQKRTKQNHPTPKPQQKSDHKKIQNFRRTSGKHLFDHFGKHLFDHQFSTI